MGGIRKNVIYAKELVEDHDGGKYMAIDIVWVFFFVLFLFAIINLAKRIKAEKQTKETETKLKESYMKLEYAFEEVTSTQNELTTRYEELKRSEAKNRKIAYSDYLTELPNRMAFTHRLDQTLLNLGEEETVYIMYIDLDNFKNINDSLGHSYGDELIIDVSHRLQEVLDEHDYLARFGGDEFIILTEDIYDEDEYYDKIKRIQNVFTYPFILALKEFFITVSIGILCVPKDAKTTQNCIKNVDAAMYEAKEMGKNTFCYYNESLNDKLLQKIELQSELRKAIDNKEFELYYQPLIALDDNSISGFEALIRWNHSEKGLIPPNDFIATAEETGLIIPIGEWVLREACKQLKTWSDRGYINKTMAVNLSARQFSDPDLAQMVYSVIEDTGVDPQYIELEITESIALTNVDYTVEIIDILSEIGIQFSLDDFGTGYSSMSYLKQLPVKNLKIDKSFLDTAVDNENDQQIISTIIKLAQILQLDVIAEGVEYEDQASFLKESLCNKAQGYLYSRPVPSDEAFNLLET